MARAINKLSAGFVSKVKDRGTYSDGGGLILRVAPGGSKQWQFRYRFRGKERYLGMGGFQTVSLSQAREAALNARQILLAGLDPVEEKRKLLRAALAEHIHAVPFKQACEQYIAAHEASWKNAKHRKQWYSSLETYIWPIIGDIPIVDIDTAMVMKVLDPIWRTKTETASRLRGRIENVLDWAAVRGFRHGENPARWRGHLQALLPARSKVQRVKHHNALHYREIGSFISDLRARSGVAAIALEFTILTAARSGEVLGATWDEIDLKQKVWTVPGDRMKVGREHTVPISDRALEILHELAEVSDGRGYVFSGPRGSKLSDMAMLQLLKRMGRSDITVHGFRSCFRDWAGDCTHHPREVAEGCLAHTVKGVEGDYRRSTALEKRRRLLQAWSEFADMPNKAGDNLVLLNEVSG